MPKTQTNSISFQMDFIKEVLNNWAVEQGGKAVIANNYLQMFEIAKTIPGPRCIIVFDGEDIRGPDEWAPVMARVDRRYAVLISRGQAMTGDRGLDLTSDTNVGKAFYDLLEEARNIIMAIQFDPSVTEATQNDPINYHGIEPVFIDGYPTDNYLIKFSIGTQIGQLFSTFSWVNKGPPNPPDNLNLFNNNNVSLTLFWTINSPQTTSTIVQRSTDGVNFSNYTTVGTNINTFIDSVINTGHTYYYRVQSTNANGNSDYSNVANISI